jgi:Zn-dependent M28 family amino/carboxypeptidase
MSASSAEDLAARLQSHVETLAGTIGERNVYRPKALAAARDYIEATWRGQGYQVSAQEYQVDGVTCANLEAGRAGAGRSDEILLLGAHYDSVRGCPGANDNGSGVAALLEIARCFADIAPALTVRFVAFVNEEPPFFMTRRQGSAVYAKAARARGDDIRLMASLETMGCYSDAPGSQRYPPLFRYFYPDRGDFIGLVSDLRSRRAMRHVAKVFRAHSDFPMQHTAAFRWIPGIAWSDHLPFWRQGYRALMVTDTAFHRYQYYHTPQDTPDKLTYPAFGQATLALCHCFAALAREGVG